MKLRVNHISLRNSPRLYAEGEIPEPDRLEIVRLVVEDNINLWDTLVYPDPECWLVKQLPSSHWAKQNQENWMGWIECANDRSRPDTVTPSLQNATSWSEEDTILYTFNRWTTFKTTWGIFLRYWRHFLWMNDQPLIIQPNNEIYLCFGSTGDIGWGKRPIQPVENELEWVLEGSHYSARTSTEKKTFYEISDTGIVARRATEAGIPFELLTPKEAELLRIRFLGRYLDPEPELVVVIYERLRMDRIAVKQEKGWNGIRPFLTGKEVYVHFGRYTPDVHGADLFVMHFADGAGYLDAIWNQANVLISPTYAHDKDFRFMVYFNSEGWMGMFGTAMDWWEQQHGSV